MCQRKGTALEARWRANFNRTVVFGVSLLGLAACGGGGGGSDGGSGHKVTVSVSNIEVEGSRQSLVFTVEDAKTLELDVAAVEGYTASESVGGTCPAGSWHEGKYTTGAITADCTVIFSATINSYTVTPSGNNVVITPNEPKLVEYSSTQAFTVTATAGNTLSALVGGTCPEGTWAGDTYTTGAVSAHCTVIFGAGIHIAKHTGVVANGNSITITGDGFGVKSPAAPLVWADFEAGTVEPTALGRITTWDNTTNLASVSGAVNDLNSVYSVGGRPNTTYAGPKSSINGMVGMSINTPGTNGGAGITNLYLYSKRKYDAPDYWSFQDSNVGAILSYTVTNGGSGYTPGTHAVTFSGGAGTGATGDVTVDGTGTITGISITNEGSGYTSPVADVSAAGLGTGFSGYANAVGINYKFLRLWTHLRGQVGVYPDSIFTWGAGDKTATLNFSTEVPSQRDTVDVGNPPVQTWLKEEYQVSRSNGSGVAIYWQDGVKKIDLSGRTTGANGADTSPYNDAWHFISVENFWSHNPPPLNAYVYFDDVYIDDSWARVMIGNASTFSASTHREMQIPSAWSDSSVTITLHQGSLAALAGMYLYVVDANGNVNENGYQLFNN